MPLSTAPMPCSRTPKWKLRPAVSAEKIGLPAQEGVVRAGADRRSRRPARAASAIALSTARGLAGRQRPVLGRNAGSSPPSRGSSPAAGARARPPLGMGLGVAPAARSSRPRARRRARASANASAPRRARGSSARRPAQGLLGRRTSSARAARRGRRPSPACWGCRSRCGCARDQRRPTGLGLAAPRARRAPRRSLPSSTVSTCQP